MIKKFIPMSLRAKLHKIKMRMDGRRFTPYTIKRTFYGRECQIYIADPMGQTWYDGSQGGDPNTKDSIEIELLRSNKLKPGARVFDLGAHQSVVAMKIACLVGEQGHVVAVEANPHNARISQKNQEINQLKHLVIVPAAISDKPGELSFSDDWGDQKVGSGVVKVPAITIDSLTEKYGAPDVVYVDVEGFECQALQGAQATLKALPDLYIEVHAGIGLEDFGGSVDKILSLLPPTGYELLAVEPCDDLSKEVAVPFHTGLPWLHKRFYLIALLKD